VVFGISVTRPEKKRLASFRLVCSSARCHAI
jgi:hypothetical protein